jgi:hypothetical protein
VTITSSTVSTDLHSRLVSALGAQHSAVEVVAKLNTPVNRSQTIQADDSESSVNTILAGTRSVYVDDVITDANDFIVLPPLADVANGEVITVVGMAGANFEVRTPADSDEEINSENCDGTKEYLFTDTQIHRFVKIDNTIGWMGHGHSAIGTAVTAVVPD